MADEVALEEKNAQLEQSQQFIFSLLSAMSDVLVACDAGGRIEETNRALAELTGRDEAALRGSGIAALMADEASRVRIRHAGHAGAAARRHGARGRAARTAPASRCRSTSTARRGWTRPGGASAWSSSGGR